MTIDERTGAALARLTENEKACLRRRLLPQTAKEMAIDLGISPHAVEKRLKMARTKLGVGSSLEVARMLAAFEAGYQGPVPRTPDLSGGTPRGEEGRGAAISPWRHPLAIAGIALMIPLLAALAIILPGQDAPPGASYEEATAYLEASFTRIDRDRSGYLDAADAPTVTVQGDGDAAPKPVTSSDATSMWLTRLDTDKDNKVSREEWVTGLRPGIMARGIPAPPSAKP